MDLVAKGDYNQLILNLKISALSIISMSSEKIYLIKRIHIYIIIMH